MSHTARTTELMYPLVERYLQRQQTQKAFCTEHGLSTSVLNYWLAKYRRQTTPAAASERGAFVEIIPAHSAIAQALMEVVYPHGVRLRLFAPVEPAYLARLLTLAVRPA
jgi:transposase-like protein